jgi:predicted MFS family arabinose efflux permease
MPLNPYRQVKSFANKTRRALLLMGLLNEPLVGLFSLLPFILRKDLKATLFQISIFTMLRPIMSVFSFYWSSRLTKRSSKLRSNLIGAWFLARVPFLFFPFINNIWYFIFSGAIYFLFYRASTPALMEILKVNLSKDSREKTFSFSSALNFSLSIAIGLVIGTILDSYNYSWKTLFFISSLIGLSAILLHLRLPVNGEVSQLKSNSYQKEPLSQQILQPWKKSLELIKLRPDFLHFQKGFMAGGIGLMFMSPALILFYVDILHLNHSAVAISRLILMGFGFIIVSSIWRRSLSKYSIEKLTSILCFGFGLFPLITICAQSSILWLYAAFFLYGITQAGSHLIWHLSGLFFAGKENSYNYTTVNILAVGLRGLIAPLIGGILCNFFGPIFVLLLGSLCCFYGCFIMLYKKSYDLDAAYKKTGE